MQPPVFRRKTTTLRRARFALWLGFIFGLLVSSVSLPVRAAPFDSTDTDWEGCSLFVQVLSHVVGSDKVVPTDTLPWGELRPEDGLIVIRPLQPLNVDELSAFLRDGGRVAVLDDFGASDQNMSRFQIQRIPAPKVPLRSLRNNPQLAIAEPATDTTAGVATGVHPVVANVTQVVTNHPMALTHPNLTPVLQVPAQGEPNGIIAVAGLVGRGRLFVASDSSLVINQMLRYPGNRAFAEGIALYLVAPDEKVGDRGGKIYLLVNTFQETGAFGNRSTVAKSLGATFREVSRFIRDTHETGLPGPMAMVLGALAALITLGWVGTAAGRAYRRIAPRFARPVPLVGQGGVAGRAAVLAAPTTHRALVVLEMKAALEEAVAVRFNLDTPVAAPALLDAVRRSGALDEERIRALKRLLFIMGRVETSVAAGTPIRVRDRDVSAAEQRIKDVLDALDRHAAHPSDNPQEST